MSLNVNATPFVPRCPPGLVDPLYIENYAWVDQRLEELYHSYALTQDNLDDFINAGLMKEHYAWVDEYLRFQSNSDALKLEDSSNEENPTHSSLAIPSTPKKKLHPAVRMYMDMFGYDDQREDADSRLECQSPIPTGKNSSPIFNFVKYCSLADSYSDTDSCAESDDATGDLSILDSDFGSVTCTDSDSDYDDF
jgi:hypothetical protein